MTNQEQSDAFFSYLAIIKLVVTINYGVAFIAVLLSIAFSHLELTTISIWCLFSLFMLDRYVTHLITINHQKVTLWVAQRRGLN